MPKEISKGRTTTLILKKNPSKNKIERDNIGHHESIIVNTTIIFSHYFFTCMNTCVKYIEQIEH